MPFFQPFDRYDELAQLMRRNGSQEKRGILGKIFRRAVNSTEKEKASQAHFFVKSSAAKTPSRMPARRLQGIAA
jgi:hypothetical protein